MRTTPFNLSFTFTFTPTDTTEEVVDKCNKLRTLIDAARAIGATVQINASNVQDERSLQRECFDALRQQNAANVEDNEAWATALNVRYSTVTKVFTGHMPVSSAVLSAIEAVVKEGIIRCDDATMEKIRSLVKR